MFKYTCLEDNKQFSAPESVRNIKYLFEFQCQLLVAKQIHLPLFVTI